MGGPPEPFFEKALGPALVFILPELPGAFLEQVGAVASKIEAFKVSQARSLLVCEILRIL